MRITESLAACLRSRETAAEARGFLARRASPAASAHRPTNPYDAEAVRWYRLAGGQELDVGFLYMVISSDDIYGDADAERWYRLAAEQGNASAQSDLGRLYAYGEGVPQDDAEAVRWYRLAADQGYGSAQFALGHMYATGAGVTQDDAEAVRWYRLAAEQGHTDAQYLLGHIYANGEVVQQDDAEAVRWYRLAAEEFREVAEQGFAIGASCEIVIGSGFFTRSAIARDGQRSVRSVWRMAINPS